MFNTAETQMLMDILTNEVGLSIEDGEIVVQYLHPYSQQFSTANNDFAQLCQQISSLEDMDDALHWIASTMPDFEDDISTDEEYYSSDEPESESESESDYDDYDDY